MVSTKRTLLVTALVALVVLSAGCLSALDDDADDSSSVNVTAEELQPDVTAAMEDVETASFTMEMTVLADGEEITTMEGDGTMDLGAERLYQELELELPIGGTEAVTQYIVGETIYTERGDQWVKQDAMELDVWDQYGVEQQPEALAAADVDVTERTTFEGHDVYVLEGEVNEEVFEHLDQQGIEDDPFADGSVEVVDGEFVQYVDVESAHVRYFDMEVVVEEAGEEVTIHMSMSYDAFNEDVDIELPDAAEDAEEIDQEF